MIKRYIVIPMPMDGLLNPFGDVAFIYITLTRWFKSFTTRKYRLLIVDNNGKRKWRNLREREYRLAVEWIAWNTAISDVIT